MKPIKLTKDKSRKEKKKKTTDEKLDYIIKLLEGGAK